MKDVKIKDVVEFIMCYRRGKAFVDWTYEQTVMAMFNGYKTGNVAHTINPLTEKIDGVIMFEIDNDYKVVHINHILTTSRAALKKFVQAFKLLYPGWDLQGNRGEKGLVRYWNTPRLCKLISLRS